MVCLDDVIYEQQPIGSLSMLFYHPALPLPNHNTQYFENLYHIQSLLDPMTLMQMVLDSYVVQFDIMCMRYAMSVSIAKDTQLYTQQVVLTTHRKNHWQSRTKGVLVLR